AARERVGGVVTEREALREKSVHGGDELFLAILEANREGQLAGRQIERRAAEEEVALRKFRLAALEQHDFQRRERTRIVGAGDAEVIIYRKAVAIAVGLHRKRTAGARL